MYIDSTWVGKGNLSMEEGMTTHSSILAWRIPRTEESGKHIQILQHSYLIYFVLFYFGHIIYHIYNLERSERKCQSLSHVQLFATPWTVAHQVPLWNSPGKNAGVGFHSLLQGIFSTQGLNAGLLRCRWILYQLSHQGPIYCINECLSEYAIAD